jgi:hypothetical protein
MKRALSEYAMSPPVRRPLKIFSTDPMLGRTSGNRISIEIANEPLQPGPVGSRLEVIDYDGGHDRFYPPVNLDDPAILMQGGLDPTESDPGSISRWSMQLQKGLLRILIAHWAEWLIFVEKVTIDFDSCRMPFTVRTPSMIAICTLSFLVIFAQTKMSRAKTCPVKMFLLVYPTT